VREWKLPPGVEEPLLAQERVEESKYYTGRCRKCLPWPPGNCRGDTMRSGLPSCRGTRLCLCYWKRRRRGSNGRRRGSAGTASSACGSTISRASSSTAGTPIGYFDQEIMDRVGNWYFDFGRPAHSFCADIGLLSPGGRFLTIARSNFITMPHDGFSDVIDEEWMLVDEEFWKLYGYPEGFRQGISSPEMQEMLRRRREMEIPRRACSPAIGLNGNSARQSPVCSLHD